MDRSETLHRLPVIQISESDTDESDLEEQTLAKTTGRNQSQREENEPDPAIELEGQKQKKSSRDKTDSKLNESSVPATEQQEENETEEFQDRSKELGQVVFIEKPDQPAIRDLLRNCQSYQMEFPIVENLKAANDEYEYLLKKEKDTGCKRTKSLSDNQTKPPVKPAKSYRNNIEKLLDQEWGPKRAPGSSVLHDYRHLFTCESVLRSTFPEADIFGLVDSTIRGPEDVPQELRHKALYHFLLSIKSKTYGVEPSDAWRDFGRLVVAEKQLELAKKAQGPDLHQNIIVKRLDFYKMQNELKEKTEEVEELSTRLSKFDSQQLTEGNPNIADLSVTHRPTRLGEMYSQLFDVEWSEAFEALKPKTEDEDDDIFPDTLYILQDLLTRIFEFCKDQSISQKTYLEESFAMAIGLTEPKEPSKHTKNAKSPEEEGKEDTEQSDSLQKDQAQVSGGEDKMSESKDYRKNIVYPTIERHARDFRKAAASTSAKTKSKLFIATGLPALIADETVRADVRVLTYVRKCVELCWYMCMQDPPMAIVSPKRGQLVDKALFSFHGRRGKIVDVCVWPALLLHEEGPLVCKGYVLPEERNRNR